MMIAVDDVYAGMIYRDTAGGSRVQLPERNGLEIRTRRTEKSTDATTGTSRPPAATSRPSLPVPPAPPPSPPEPVPSPELTGAGRLVDLIA